MKKFFMSIFVCLSLGSAYAQVTAQVGPSRQLNEKLTALKDSVSPEQSNIPKCFCCDVAYKLPPPVIKLNGSPISPTMKPYCSCDGIKLSVDDCPGAKFDWSVKDDKGNNISFSPSSGSAITLTYGLAQQQASGATAILVTVSVVCNGKKVSTTSIIPLKPVPTATIDFSLNTTGAGVTTATANTLAPSNGNGWTLKEVNCPGPNPCSWVAGPIKWQSSGNTINIPAGVLVKGKCYVLTHYVNVCSPSWVVTDCTVYKATCFTVSGNSFKIKAVETKSETQVIQRDMLKEAGEVNLKKSN